MDIQKELEESRRKRREVVDQLNQLEKQKQMLLQEALRLDGEVRVLGRLVEKKSMEEGYKDAAKPDVVPEDNVVR